MTTETKPSQAGGLTAEQLVVACRNIGYDLTCGQCASVFYTGIGTYPHDDTCTTPRDRAATVTVEVSSRGTARGTDGFCPVCHGDGVRQGCAECL